MTNLQTDRAPFLETSAWVVCLCAEWCRACKDYRTVFSQMADLMAETYPGHRFVWIDVEDQAELVGDLDIETFPTLLVGNAEGLNFIGAVTPQPDVLARLLQALLKPGAQKKAHVAATRQIIDQISDSPGLWLQAACFPSRREQPIAT